MILSEKITEERKKNGWSQEELSEKLDVSRQAVSKWESAQSTPDLQKIIRLSEIFQVSTDYLLKDDMEMDSNNGGSGYIPEDMPVRMLSMQEANDFMDWRRKSAPMLARAVVLCIISPALLIFLAGMSSAEFWGLTENMAAVPMFIAIAMEFPEYIISASVPVLLILVAAGVYQIVQVCTIKGSYDILLQEGEYSSKEKHIKKRMEIFPTVYWCTATALYLGWSFWTQKWDITWIVWAVAGLLYAATTAIIRVYASK